MVKFIKNIPDAICLFTSISSFKFGPRCCTALISISSCARNFCLFAFLHASFGERRTNGRMDGWCSKVRYRMRPRLGKFNCCRRNFCSYMCELEKKSSGGIKRLFLVQPPPPSCVCMMHSERERKRKEKLWGEFAQVFCCPRQKRASSLFPAALLLIWGLKAGRTD